MRNIVAVTIFRFIPIILLPIGAISYLLFVIKLITFSGNSGTSAPELASFYTRWVHHKLSTLHIHAMVPLQS